MRAELASVNHCAVPFFSRATAPPTCAGTTLGETRPHYF